MPKHTRNVLVVKLLDEPKRLTCKWCATTELYQGEVKLLDADHQEYLTCPTCAEDIADALNSLAVIERAVRQWM